jgi:hypothetical protein
MLQLSGQKNQVAHPDGYRGRFKRAERSNLNRQTLHPLLFMPVAARVKPTFQE